MDPIGILFLLLRHYTHIALLRPRKPLKNLNPESWSLEQETSQISNSNASYWTKNENLKKRFKFNMASYPLPTTA
jgi:hypothetical protein